MRSVWEKLSSWMTKANRSEEVLEAIDWDSILAELSYRADGEGDFSWGSSLKARLAPVGVDLLEIIDIAGVQGFIGHSTQGQLVIVFRGTDPGEVADIFTDVRGRMVDYGVDANDGRSKVHRGFASALDWAWPKIEDEAEKWRHMPVVVVGHSLGGALATLCAFRLSYYGQVERLTTFGAPMVGNKHFAKLVGERVRLAPRVVRGCDKVTRLWFSQIVLSLLFNGRRYYHPTGKNVSAVFIDSQQVPHVEPDRYFVVSNQIAMYLWSFWRYFADGFHRLANGKLPFWHRVWTIFRPEDHSMQGYREACDRR